MLLLTATTAGENPGWLDFACLSGSAFDPSDVGSADKDRREL